MYRELIQELTMENPWVAIQPPCSDSEIAQAERVVGCLFPPELRDLLRELNGDGWCILSAGQIIENVERSRECFLPLFEECFSTEAYIERVGRFLFFAANGCGDYYCYRIHPDGTVDESTIYIWEHEDLEESCCWKPVASNMIEFLTKYYQSEI